jgi:dienelactone hydrolase
MFRDLAWGLADSGIAVLRYEKRTRQHATKFGQLPSYTVREETLDDALLAVAALRRLPGIDSRQVFILGHSMGGMLAPRIAEADPEIKGLLILAGNTRPLPDIVIEQILYLGTLNGDLVAPELALEALKREATRVMDPALPADTPASELLLQLPAAYWRDLSTYKPAEAAARLKIPMLILQGERDYQVTLGNLIGWRDALAGRSDVSIKTYPELNHIFMPGEGRSMPEEYYRPNHVPDYVVADIVRWIAAAGN